MSPGEAPRSALRILVSAAEISSDRHAALVVRELRRQAALRDLELHVFGVGGPALRAEGLLPIVQAEDLLVMGGFDVLRRLRQIRRALESLVKAATQQKPDFALVVDYPDFHFRLARRLKDLGIPVVDFIPPKVWVWRAGRMRVMREIFARVFCIFPFEPALHQKAGVRSEYVGNPLVEQLPLTSTREELRRERYGSRLAPTEIFAVLPGSRPGELNRHWDPMFRAALRVAQQRELGGAWVEFALPESERMRRETWQGRLNDVMRGEAFEPTRVRLSFGESEVVLRVASAGLIKSGTSTLEAALLGCHQVVAYRPDRLTQWVFEGWIRRRYAGPVALVNLFSGWKPGDRLIAPEILMDDFSVDRLEEELGRLVSEPQYRSQMEADYQVLQKRVRESSGASPSAVVAARLLALWEEGFP